MFKGIDPRTGKALTDEQIIPIRKHFKRRKVLRMTSYDYIFKNEVITGICLLDQLIDDCH